MEKQTVIKRVHSPLPTCRITADHSEMTDMIRAILDGHFTISDEPLPALTVSCVSDAVILKGGSASRVIERPFTPETLLDAAEEMAVHDGFSADAAANTAVFGERSVQLTATEFRLYTAILEGGGNFVTAEELSRAVWGRYDRNLCTVYISYLRHKLDSAFGDGTLVSVRGKGYRVQTANKHAKG